jgi:hypothetical protein
MLQEVQLEEGMEFSLRKGGIRSRKLHFPKWKKKYWIANKKKEKAFRPSLCTRIVLPD